MLIEIGKGGFSKQQKQIAYLPKKILPKPLMAFINLSILPPELGYDKLYELQFTTALLSWNARSKI